MTADELVRTIGAILAPAVMLTCCAIFLNGTFVRYESVSGRLRSMHRERLDLLNSLLPAVATDAAADDREHRRIREIERQLPDLLRRHSLIRDAVLTVSVALLILVLTMILIAAAVLTQVTTISILALLFFLGGTATFLVGVAIVAYELALSHRDVAYEIKDGLAIH